MLAVVAHHSKRAVRTHDLIQTLGGTETSRSHANDKDVNIATRPCQQACLSIDAYIVLSVDLLRSSSRGWYSHVGTHGGELFFW